MTTPLEGRIARLEGSFEQTNQRLGTLEQDMRAGFERLERQLDTLASRIDDLASRVDALASRVDALDARINGRIDQLMYWQLGLLAAIAASILAVVITRLL